VIDVGVQGGEHPRWELLGDQVRVYGFDAISEAVDRIKKVNADRPNRVYRATALGDEDGEREFFVGTNTFSSSFYHADWSGGVAAHGDGAPGPRMVEIRRLDSLFAAGEIPAADYIKIDCEGFEPEVLRGARTYLGCSNILCVTAETAFDINWVYPRTAFAEINDIVVQHRLSVFDLNCVRYRRPAYVAARAKHPWSPADPMHDAPDLDVGQPGTFDFVFCRDFVAEDIYPNKFPKVAGSVTSPTVDKLIKSMINFELHGLMDCAVDLGDHFHSLLQERLDADEAIALLTRRPPHARNTADVTECLRMLAALRTRVIDTDQDMARKESRIAELEGMLAAQRTRAIDTDQDMARKEARIAELEGMLAALRTRAIETDQDMAHKEAHLAELEGMLAAQRGEFEANLVSQAAEFDNSLRSVRFLSTTLRRELERRARRRLGLA
jgi:FkbM family methyltransferase